MEWKSNLRRTQSLRSVPLACDKPNGTAAGLRDKKVSVSQLVSRYQTTVEVSVSTQAKSVNNGEAKPKQVLKEITPSLLEGEETPLASLTRRNDEREQERSQATPGLTRSRSMGSLQNSAGSIGALKARFESKASAQNELRSGFRAANFTSPHKAEDIMPVMNGIISSVPLKRSSGEQKPKIPADAPVSDANTDAKEDRATRKVVDQTRKVRRKTIGGVDFEGITAFQADEKRRTVADFRDSSFNQTKETLCVSVKVLSALYLSKVAPQEPTHSPSKQGQDQSSESRKIVKITKMDFQQRKDDLPSPPLAKHLTEPEDISGEHSQKSMPAQLSKEKLYQQRQKCELKRLLKHTHPELKMLDEVVDDELAEVLNSEIGVTAGETGYEGEVFSRRLIFENCALSSKLSPYTPKIHMADEKVDEGDVNKTPAVFEELEERARSESVKGIVQDYKTLGSTPEHNREFEEEMIRIDVQASRRIFESQSVKTSRPNPDNKFQGKVSILEDDRGPVQKQKHEFEMCNKENVHSENKSNVCTNRLDLIDQPHKQEPCVHTVGVSTYLKFSGNEEVYSDKVVFDNDPTSLSGAMGFEEIIKTSSALLENNPFISTNISRENSYAHASNSQIHGAAQDFLISNVKNRAYLFESMPFDQIRHQNKDEIETLVENIKETLNILYRVNAIHSDGLIIEVNETMIAKKAQFTLSETGPKIKYDDVAEGGAQNFIVQLLPRANLKPQITYLKEDRKERMEATVLNVPVYQHQFTSNQDTELKTANVVQLVEDILNQDNSLRKGVIIQQEANKCAEVVVYSLYNYFDEEDVKSYSAPQRHAAEDGEPEKEEIHISRTENQGLRRGIVESTINCLLETSQDQACTGSIRPNVTVKGNVKLFKSCIEKGDLEYLKTLQADPTVQEKELPLNRTVAELSTELHGEQRGDQAEDSEWVPVDVKRLKGMFSVDQRQNQGKQNINKNRAPTTTISPAFTGQHVPLGKSQSSTECNVDVFNCEQRKDNVLECGGLAQEEVCTFTGAPQGSYLHLETRDDDSVHQAQLIEVVDDNDEITDLQAAIHSLQQATIEAKSLYHSSQNKQKRIVQESSKPAVVSVTAGDVKDSGTEAELHQENEDQQTDVGTESRWNEVLSASHFTSVHKTDRQHTNVEMCHEDSNSKEVQTTESSSKNGQKGTDVVQKHLETFVDSSETHEEEHEVVFPGKVQEALDSLERANINITRGDFKAAMIYKNSSKPHKDRLQNVEKATVQKPIIGEILPVTEYRSTQVQLRQDVSKEQVTTVNAELQSKSKNKTATSAVSVKKTKRPVGSKPAIPPKPEHLKVKQRDNKSSDTRNTELTQRNTIRPEMQAQEETVAQPQPTLVSCKNEHVKHLSKINGSDAGPNSINHEVETIQMSQKIQIRHQYQCSFDNINKNTFSPPEEIRAAEEVKSPEERNPVKESTNETDESPVNFNLACQKFGGKKAFSVKNAPVKPKRVKIAQSDTKNLKDTSVDNNSKPQKAIADPSYTVTKNSGQTADSKDKHEREINQEGKVEMREKRGRSETENERRQRLSVHMDEIMRGNITAALEIFDNLRKQEELQSILSRVEEIEQDTSEVDVGSLRRVYENVPGWVVSSDKKKQEMVQVEHREEKSLLKDDLQNKSSMAHIFGDLERASEEIMNLKEQTLARLIDIEETIKKALYSVSTLKSDTDIAGLSCLFKESLGTMLGSPTSGISKISIGSSRTKSPQAQERPTTNTALLVEQGASKEVASAKQRPSPPSSPAFISIQSVRKIDKTSVVPPETTICAKCQQSPKTEGKFCTTKTLICNSPAQNRKGSQKQPTYSPLNPKQELSVLEVQTDHEGNSIIGTKTVSENYEQSETFGKRFYSSKTSTVVTTQPETMTLSTGQAVVSPTTYQVTTYPEVRLPINHKA
ncbi:LIM domain-containing protein isoform X1 [Scophthalmus maximus]|uniref:LIM domain-containing protein isoform X1 n=2 Tax=Scophthalmus maximus TaxID=52904 RepID=UPI001FA86382|nr:LIM domain-containing protein isoform X1 [Scophthalmus maximus]XP_047185813.1 LIM domain-containing protein isoform X1 [Scophthalmus maximus]